MTTDTIWTDILPEPEPEPEPVRADTAGRHSSSPGRRKAMLAVLVSLLALTALAVGLVVLLGAGASAVGGCGGG